ncbi:unnamed protein product [Albugo candida]|uniref:Uncharacterized protein n=1 Tax=Albugo candida TaxID=65357 RepID=A0A024FVM6_9STRA|nr:unnamed protein product [Albugo candida]|eukprot:CCI10714.1 unnamed protein product [Albugo candida]
MDGVQFTYFWVSAMIGSPENLLRDVRKNVALLLSTGKRRLRTITNESIAIKALHTQSFLTSILYIYHSLWRSCSLTKQRTTEKYLRQNSHTFDYNNLEHCCSARSKAFSGFSSAQSSSSIFFVSFNYESIHATINFPRLSIMHLLRAAEWGC